MLRRYPWCSYVLARAELAQHARTLTLSFMALYCQGQLTQCRAIFAHRTCSGWASCVCAHTHTGAVSRDRIETGSQGKAHKGGFGDHPRRRQRPSAALSHRLHASYCEAPLRRAWCTHACATLAPGATHLKLAFICWMNVHLRLSSRYLFAASGVMLRHRQERVMKGQFSEVLFCEARVYQG